MENTILSRYLLTTKSNRLKKIATKNPEMWSLYTKQRNRVIKEIRNSIQNHYKTLINDSNGDPKKMLKTINRVLEKDVKSTNFSAIESEGKTLTKEYDMLEALNRHFVSVGPDLAKQIRSCQGAGIAWRSRTA